VFVCLVGYTGKERRGVEAQAPSEVKNPDNKTQGKLPKEPTKIGSSPGVRGLRRQSKAEAQDNGKAKVMHNCCHPRSQPKLPVFLLGCLSNDVALLF
jgi:hypothetical protein